MPNYAKAAPRSVRATGKILKIKQHWQPWLLFAASLILITMWAFAIPELTGQRLAPTIYQDQTERVVIPSLNANFPIVYVDSLNPSDIEEGMRHGVVHLKGTAHPGQIGNSYLVGDFNTTFSKLPEIRVGQDILLVGQSESLVFQVTDVKIVQSDDLTVTTQQTGGKRIITLQTHFPMSMTGTRYLVVGEVK